MEKYRLHAEVSSSLIRMKAIDAAIEGTSFTVVLVLLIYQYNVNGAYVIVILLGSVLSVLVKNR